MSKELVVSSTPHQTRLALLKDDRLIEIYVERESHQGLAGSIHKGRVTRVLPGMQSAFVDIGLERDAFLYVSDFVEELEEYEESSGEAAELNDGPAGSGEGRLPRRNFGPPDGLGRPRDRRGRRGRQRRPREGGEGFPKSKYATIGEGGADSAATDTPEAKEPILTTPVAEPERETEAGFTILPGESLAKYGGSEASQEAQTHVTEEAEEGPANDEETAEAPEGPHGSGTEADRRPEQDEFPSVEEGPIIPPMGESRPTAGGVSGDAAAAAAMEATARQEGTLLGAQETGEEPRQSESVAAEVLDGQESAVSGEAAPLIAARTAGNESEESQDTVDDAVAPPSESSADGEDAFVQAADNAPSQEEEPVEGVEAEAETVAAGSTPAGENDEAHHPAPGLPLPEEQERGRPEAARVRGREGSSRALRRRGRRGRRGGRRREGEEPVPAPVEDSQTTESSVEKTDGTPATSITDMLSKGNEVLVQIAKEPLGKKGARITSHIALPGRFLVYMPTVDHVGVSRKIGSFDERRRLRSVVREHRTGMPGGFIVRTAGEGVEEEEIRGDMLFLYNLWLDVRQKAEQRSGPGLIHQDLDIVERVLRDQLDEDFKTIWVDAEDEYERILRFVERFQPKFLSRVKLYTRPRPVFDEFNVTKELEKALRPKVWLKSGGYIVINHTEALVAIDVNTGKYVGKSDRLEDTIVNTNLEAAQEIVRQMRLRDLGGIVVVDFIDMEDRKNRVKVEQELERVLHEDPAPSKSLPFNDFGLVAITRKRVKKSLERTLCAPCSACGGSGLLKSVETVIYEIMEEARGMAPDMEPQKDVTLRVNPEVARTLKSRRNRYLQEIEDLLRSHVLVRSDLSLHREHFDIN